ncbi:MAG: helix-turn-helix transcriptional regulator [Candidatus Poribacteria bacterium]
MTAPFGKELLIRIKKKYAYQARFAEEIDVKEASVTQWLKGRTYPSKENLVKICEALSWDLKEAEKLIENEKKRDALQKYGAEFDTEEILTGFCSLPLPKQEKLLKEMTEIFYARKLPSRVVINLGGEKAFAV